MLEMLEVSDNYIMCSAKAVVETGYAAGAHTVGYTMESKTELLHHWNQQTACNSN